MRRDELKLQSACFQWAWNSLPQTRRLLFHVPNGGARSIVEASWLKASGVVKGVPDLLFVWYGRLYAFEFKRPGGKARSSQEEVHRVWLEHGVPTYVVDEEEKFREILTSIVKGRPSLGFATN